MLFSNPPGTDRVLAMLLTLSSEVWALRERLAAWEAVAARKGVLSESDVEAYQFTPAELTRLAEQRSEFLGGLFRALDEPPRATRARGQARARPKGAARKK